MEFERRSQSRSIDLSQRYNVLSKIHWDGNLFSSLHCPPAIDFQDFGSYLRPSGYSSLPSLLGTRKLTCSKDTPQSGHRNKETIIQICTINPAYYQGNFIGVRAYIHKFLYTDGNSIGRHFGAAALASDMDLIGIPTTRIDYMDNTKTLSVHVAESKGIVLALRMVERIASALASLHCIIFPDNQVAIRSMNNSKRQGGQDILIRAVPLLDELCMLRRHHTLDISVCRHIWQ